MPPPSTVADYLDVLTRAIQFDRALARRVRLEVEDHLCEAAAADTGIARHEAERQAIAACGDPRDIARQYAALSLLQQSRRAGGYVAFVLAGIFVAMKLRTAWYHWLQWELDGTAKHLGALFLRVDAGAFMLALGLCLAGFIYARLRGVPATRQQPHPVRSRRCIALCIAAAAALIVSVAADAALMALRVSGSGLCASAMPPVLSVAAEFMLSLLLVSRIRASLRCMAGAEALLRNG